MDPNTVETASTANLSDGQLMLLALEKAGIISFHQRRDAWRALRSLTTRRAEAQSSIEAAAMATLAPDDA